MRNLSVKVTHGVMAPHKAIMLISIIDLIKSNKITSNIIPADDLLAEAFKKNWNHFVANRKEFSHFKCSIWTPYWHMKNETFWHFRTIQHNFNVDSLVPAGQTASIGAIRSHIQYAFLDVALYELLQNADLREIFKEILIDTYKLRYTTESTSSVEDSNNIQAYKSANTETEEITIIIDKSQHNQLIEKILNLNGVIQVLQKNIPLAVIVCYTSKITFDYLLSA